MARVTPEEFRILKANAFEGLDHVKSNVDHLDPNTRHTALYDAYRWSRGMNSNTRFYAQNALSDARYIAHGAIRFAATKLPAERVLPTVQNSTDLLLIAKLSQDELRRITKEWQGVDYRHVTIEDVLPANVLELDEQKDEVKYTYDALRDIDDVLMLQANRGCPASGAFLDTFFQKYVTVIYGPAVASGMQL